MFRNKEVRLFEKTNLALECLKLAIEIQLGMRIQFRTMDIVLPKNQDSKGAGIGLRARFSLKKSPGGTSPLWEVLTVRLSVIETEGKITCGRLVFTIKDHAGTYRWYNAYAMYDYVLTEGVNFPEKMRVAETHAHGGSSAMWRLGSSALDVKEVPMFGPNALVCNETV